MSLRSVLFTTLALALATDPGSGDSPSPPPPSPPPPYPRGFSDFVYILSVDVGWNDTSWQGAEAKCRQEGFYLARILSARDQALMRYKLQGFRAGMSAGFYTGSNDANCPTWPCGMWFGANDLRQEGTWQWSNGQLLSLYGFGAVTNGLPRGVFPWGSTADGGTDDEPNDYGGYEHCGRLDLQYSEGLWNDVSCEWRNPFVCEMPLDNTTGRGGYYAAEPFPPPVPPFPPPQPSTPPPGSPPPLSPAPRPSPDPFPPPPPLPDLPEPSPPPPPVPSTPQPPAVPPYYPAPAPAPFNWMVLAIPASLLAGCFMGLLFFKYCNDAPKIAKPRTKRKEEEVDMTDFMRREKGDSVLEDGDPELNMNPIIVEKMQRDREATRKKGAKKKGGGVVNSALSVLRFSIRNSKKIDDEDTPENQAKRQKGYFKQVDAMVTSKQKAAAGSSGGGMSKASACAMSMGPGKKNQFASSI